MTSLSRPTCVTITDGSDPADRLAAVRRRIEDACARSGRSPGEVTLLAASKYTDAAGIAYLAAAGQRAFGENRVQDAAEKLDELPRQLRRAIEVHLIGRLQGNKVRAAVAAFDLVQSVDSLRLATALGGAAAAAGRRLPVLVQVNVAGDPTKGGFGVDELRAASEALLAVAALEVRGLMTIGPAVEDAEAARPTFRALRELREGLHGAWPAEALRHLSMGMSADFEVAIEEGATIVRVGTALFGAGDPAGAGRRTAL